MRYSHVLFRLLFVFAVVASSFTIARAQTAEKATVIAVVGAAGEDEFGKDFNEWASQWAAATAKANANFILIGSTNAPGTNDLATLQETLGREPKEGSELWLVLLGHGTFDGREAKFNLRGPDLSATALAELLKPFKRPVAVIDASSSSSPFLAKLSVPGRVVITASRSGNERNFARFGGYLSKALVDPKADIDQDGQVSLLEAFIIGSHATHEFYKSDGRMLTEHALLDDNGDGLGTQADWFRGIRAVKRAKDGAAPDGLRAHQWHLIRSDFDRGLSTEIRQKRDALELSIAKLRDSKADLEEDEYYRKLEELLLQVARLYEPQLTN